MKSLQHRILMAYGGEAFWQAAHEVSLEMSAWGWAFRLKCRSPIKQARLLLSVHEPVARITPIDSKGNTGILTGHDVRIESATGEILAERNNARRYFPSGRRTFFWDALDQTYFAGYAAWNYFVFPALLLRNDIQWTQIAENTLEAVFPPRIPTHSRIQQFHFEPDTGLLKQHDYTAEVIGARAHAAHLVLEHKMSGSIPFSSARRVFPRKRNGSPTRFPLLVGITVHQYDAR